MKGPLLLFSSLALAGCSTHHEFRVAAVGDASAQQTATATAAMSAGTAPLIVASGNSLIGPASQLLNSTGAPTSGIVNGTVSSLLLTTNQTVVQLSDGASVLLNGASATLGDVVSIDLGTNKVIGGPSSLVGAQVLTGAGSAGQLASVSIGGKTVLGTGTLTSAPSATGAITRIATPVHTTTTTLSNVLGNPLRGGCC